MSNIEVIQRLYAAFGRGDIASILGMLTETVEWGHPNPSTQIAFLQPRRGRAEVAKFFEAFATLQMNAFNPKLFLENGETVVVLVDEDVTVKATGRRIPTQEQVHIWKVNERGQIAAHYWHSDTHRFFQAYQAAK